MTTWRSIEKDPPKNGDPVWVATRCECWRLPYIWSETARFNSEHLGYTHWHPCDQPVNLPPNPKTQFDEWCEKTQCARDLADGYVVINIDHKIKPVDIAPARVLFEAGYEAGKAANGNV